MCWNIQVSAASAVVGWVACALLLRRGGVRDKWYARYLFTYTFTQLIDIALWLQHEKTELKACQEFQYSFTVMDESHPQYTNWLITKCTLPLVVLSQYAMQCTYPSPEFNSKPWHRPLLIALGGAVPAVCMVFCFGCTMIVPSSFPANEETLHWGGDWGWSWDGLKKGEGAQEYWWTQVFSLLSAVHVSVLFWMLMPSRVFWVHVGTLSCVVSFQAITEGTIGLGSKWCTYCLVYSGVYLADPIWNVKDKLDSPQTTTSARAISRGK